MSNNKRHKLDNENYNNSSISNKRRKLNPDNENYNNSSIITLSNNNKRRKIDKNKVNEMKKRQANYNINSNSNSNSKGYDDNYIEINHCKEAIQMAVDIALKKKEVQIGGKTQKKRTNNNKKNNKRKTNKK